MSRWMTFAINDPDPACSQFLYRGIRFVQLEPTQRTIILVEFLWAVFAKAIQYEEDYYH